MKKPLYIILFLILVLNFSVIKAQNIQIIPQPNSIIQGSNSFTINENTKIISSDKTVKLAEDLRDYFKSEFKLSLKNKATNKPLKNYIKFQTDNSLANEAYELTIEKNTITICAKNSAGWFYGSQTLMQLLSYNAHYSKYEKEIDIKEIKIIDKPRFKWRAFMLDEARYFKGKEQVKLLLNEMAYLKMNIFHWHLVDDQGWRIEIKKYPKLTEIGSKRKSTQIGPLQWESPIQSAESHEGFYTQDEIKEIVAYAKERNITIVPEIEMPGHSTAAIASYSWLGTSKKEIEVPIKFGVGKDVYDVTNPRVTQFLKDVLDEVMELFPSKVIHIGGDEVKYNHWKNSSSVKQYMSKKNLKTPADLQVYFTNSISKYLQSKGRRMMGWNEIMGHNLHEYQDKSDTKTSQKLAKESIVHFWKGDVELATTAAKNGYEIVNSLHSSTYLDYLYKNLPLSKSYAFNPIPKDLSNEYHDKVIGLGCQMWGEWIPTDGEMHYKVFPRIAAYAEVGWTNLEKKDFSDFKINLKNLQKRWSAKDIYFAPDDYVEKK
ncbi:beta-N-acetylhexosaminidase [Polaribacter dokdonensis]|uniref:beta-N-acetylhexosaminidase n=1 Tax=Polaribacter dokdonensis DSW-5 TaxID=1300348 RepID=A0A0N0CEI6_9FLAO|nr:beta-N-acetylhexosaminidase [Polaribacter dokdonensis]KOY50478.1 Glycoside hydrolase family 20 [Polaribacter dokdonensis DSW-5]SEE59364.1 hexosaminidase [Polaribacter dokdonensis DSW-5]